jgi:hypothetical protein
METLLRHRPTYPNVLTANAVTTLTHEMMHATGIRREAEAECFAMQLTGYMALELGVPRTYSFALAHLALSNYAHRPPSYRDLVRCRENGVWDLFPNEDSRPGTRRRVEHRGVLPERLDIDLRAGVDEDRQRKGAAPTSSGAHSFGERGCKE